MHDKKDFAVPANRYGDDVEAILITEEEIKDRVQQLADAVSEKYADAEQDLLDYEEEEEQTAAGAGAAVAAGANAAAEPKKGGYVSIHSSGFRDFLLKPELLRAIVDCGFEHPSEVQHECIPQAILGMDILCQAKSGMGKTAVFVLATLQQLDPVEGQVGPLDRRRRTPAHLRHRSPSS